MTNDSRDAQERMHLAIRALLKERGYAADDNLESGQFLRVYGREGTTLSIYITRTKQVTSDAVWTATTGNRTELMIDSYATLEEIRQHLVRLLPTA